MTQIILDNYKNCVWISFKLVKFRNSKKNVLKIVLIIVNINKDENKSLISNQFSLKNDLWNDPMKIVHVEKVLENFEHMALSFICGII